MQSLPSKTDFLQKLSALSYEERQKEASLLGVAHKESPGLDAWIAEMRNHPAPKVPAVPAEDGFTELLPPQKLNIAKFYDQDQAALAVAAAAGKHQVFLSELSSPSKQFKQLAAKVAVKMTPKIQGGLETLEKEVLTASPKTRKKLLANLILRQETGLLEKLYPKIHAQKGANVAIAFLHGCSSAFVKIHLNQETFDHKELSWKKLAQFHAPLIFELLTEELKKNTKTCPSSIWTKWEERLNTSWSQLFYKAKMTQKWWDLYEAFPIWSRAATSGSETDEKAYHYSLIKSIRTNYKHFWNVCSVSMFKFIRATLTVGWNDQLRWVFPEREFWEVKFLKENITQVLTILDIASSADETLASSSITYRNFTYFTRSLQQLPPWAALQYYPAYLKFCQKLSTLFNDESVLSALITSAGQLISKCEKKLIDHLTTGNEKEAQVVATSIKNHFKDLMSIIKLQAAATPDGFNGTPYFNQSQVIVTNPWLDVVNRSFSIKPNVEFLQSLKELVKSFLERRGDAKKDHNGPWVSSWTVNYAQYLNYFLAALYPLWTTESSRTWMPQSEADVKAAVQMRDDFFNMLFESFSTDPFRQGNLFLGLFPYISLQQRVKLFELFSMSHLESYANDSKLKNFLKYMPTPTYAKSIAALIASDNVTDVVKDDLQSFRDLSDHALRKELQLASDSNSDTARILALQHLAESTYNSPDDQLLVQIKRTLTFVRTKIKNEKIDMRVAVLANLFRAEPHKLFPAGIDQEIFDLIFAILQDALEVQDLDKLNADYPAYTAEKQENHPCLRAFFDLSKAALQVGSANPKSGIFDFGVELQWKVALFRGRLVDVAKSFRLLLPSALIYTGAEAKGPFFRTVESQNTFASLYVEALRSRVSGKNPKWTDEVKHWEPLMCGVLSKSWSKCPTVLDHLKGLIENIKAQKKNDFSATIVESNHPALPTFEHIMKLEAAHAFRHPIVNDYCEALLHSTQAKVVVFQWTVAKERGLRRKKQKQQRDKTVSQLLDITPSAIYLKFVWRHLMRWRTNKLNAFIGAKNPFRGVFFEEPLTRVFKYPKPAATKKTTGPKRAQTFPAPKNTVPNCKGADKTVAKAQKKMEKELLVNPDHPDFFVLPGCFGLTRFLPSQIEKLAEQWLALALNPDASVPQRTKACIRWTLMPTVNYPDIVEVIEANRKAVKDEDGKVIKKALEVNLVEALIKGVSCNDEPLAPLNYLLTPEFLSGDLARIAAFAVSQAVPHLKAVGLTDIIKLVLSGKRREGLKITAYKAMIALLARTPIPKHISMVQHEWRRTELHRDVRIQIIKAAILFLQKNSEQSVEVAWEVLNGAVLKKKADWKFVAEMFTVMLGACPLVESRQTHDKGKKPAPLPPFVDESIFMTPALHSHLEALTKYQVPREHCERYANEIILPLVQAEENDVRTLAMFALFNFRSHGKVVDVTAKLYHDFLVDAPNNALLNSKKLAEIVIFNARWSLAAKNLLYLAKMSPQTACLNELFTRCDRQLVAQVNQQTSKNILAYTNDQRRKRLNLLTDFETYLDSLHLYLATYQQRESPWDAKQEANYFGSLKDFGNIFWHFLLKRRIVCLQHQLGLTVENVCQFIHETITYSSTNVALGTIAVTESTSLVSLFSWTDNALKFQTFLYFLHPDRRTGQTSAYKSILIRLVLQLNRLNVFGEFFKENHTESLRVPESLEKRLELLLDFVDFSLHEVSADGIHDHARTLGTELNQFVGGLIGTPKYQWSIEEVLPKFDQQLLNGIFSKIPKLTGTPLAVALDFAKEFIKADYFTFLQSSEHVGKILHFLVQRQTATQDPTEIKTFFVSMLKKIQEISAAKKSVSSATAIVKIMTAVLDMNLENFGPIGADLFTQFHSSSAEPKFERKWSHHSDAYRVASMNISFAVLQAFPQFVSWRPECFHRFFTTVLEYDLIEPVASPMRSYAISDALVRGFYKEMASSKLLKDTEKYVDEAAQYIHRLLKLETPNPLFVRHAAFHLTEAMGYLSSTLEDTTWVWRSQFVELLDLFCGDKDGKIQRLAWAVDTEQPASATPYNGLISEFGAIAGTRGKGTK